MEKACYMAAELALHDSRLLFTTALDQWCRLVSSAVVSDVVAAVPDLADCRAALDSRGGDEDARKRRACCVLLTTCAFRSRSVSASPFSSADGDRCRTDEAQVAAASAAMSRAFPVVPPLSQEARGMLGRLWVLCKSRRTSLASRTLKEAVAAKRSEPVVSFSKLPADGLPGLNVVSPVNRGDVVWYAWRLCLLLCGGEGDRLRFVRGALACYVHDYKKKDRVIRSPLLEAALHVATDGLGSFEKSHKPRPDVDALLSKLVQNIDIVFEDIVAPLTAAGRAKQVDEPLPSPVLPPAHEIPSPLPPSSVADDDASSPPQRQSSPPASFDEKMRCLFTVFYVDHARQRRMDAKRVACRMRELRHNGGHFPTRNVAGGHFLSSSSVPTSFSCVIRDESPTSPSSAKS